MSYTQVLVVCGYSRFSELPVLRTNWYDIHFLHCPRIDRELHCPQTDAFSVLTHGICQSRLPERVLHFETTRATAEFSAWVLHYLSSATQEWDLGLTILISCPVADDDIGPSLVVGGHPFPRIP